MTSPEMLMDYISSHDFDGFRNCIPSARGIDIQVCYQLFDMMYMAYWSLREPIFMRIHEKLCQDLLNNIHIITAVEAYECRICSANVFVRENLNDNDLERLLCESLRNLRNGLDISATCAIMFRRGLSYEDASRLITNIQVPDDNDELRLLSHDLLFPDQND